MELLGFLEEKVAFCMAFEKRWPFRAFFSVRRRGLSFMIVLNL